MLLFSCIVLALTLVITAFGTTTTEVIPAAPSVADHANLVLGQSDFTSSATLTSAGLSGPAALAVDKTNNRLYVADRANNRVLGWDLASGFTSSSSAVLVIGQSSFRSSAAGTPSASSLNSPGGLAVDSTGRLYVADTSNHRVLVYNDPFGTDTTADFVFGQANFTSNASGCTTASATVLCNPGAVTLDSTGRVYIADTGNNRVLAFDNPLSTDNTADAVFGQADFSSNFANRSLANPARDTLSAPGGVAVDNSGLYISDSANNRILKFEAPTPNTIPDASADVVIGQSSFSEVTINSIVYPATGCNRGTSANPGTPPTPTAANQLCAPAQIELDATGNLFVTDTRNNRVLKFNSPIVSVPATDADAANVFGQPNFTSNTANNGGILATSLNLAKGLTLDASGNLFIADTNNNRVLRYNPPFATTACAATLVLGQSGFTTAGANLLADAAALKTPTGIAIDRSHNPNRLYISDPAHNRVLGWTISALLTNNRPAELVIGQTSFTGVGAGSANTTNLKNPNGLAVDSTGNLYVADTGNNRVLLFLDPFGTDKIADRVFGQPNFTASSCDQNLDTLCIPSWVAVDPLNRLYVSDKFNRRILGYPTPLANSTSTLSIGNGDPAVTASSLGDPGGIATDSSGNLYVADTSRDRVLFYSLPFTNGSEADVVIGQPSLDTSTAWTALGTTAKTLSGPVGVTLDANNNLYITEFFNHRILRWNSNNTPTTTNTNGLTANEVIGQDNDFTTNVYGTDDNRFSTVISSEISGPIGVAIDSFGWVYTTDQGNNRMLRFSANPPSRIRFTTPPRVVYTDLVSAVLTLQLTDANNNPAPAPQALTVNLSSNSGGVGQFSLTSSPFTPVTSLTIPIGATEVSFYYRDSAAGAPTITATLVSPSFVVTQGVEVKSQPATLVYKNVDDGSAHTLSNAIAVANSNASSPDAELRTVNFALQANGPITFQQGITLPALLPGVIVKGSCGGDGKPLIVIDGTNAGGNGLTLNGGVTIDGVKLMKLQLHFLALDGSTGPNQMGKCVVISKTSS